MRVGVLTSGIKRLITALLAFPALGHAATELADIVVSATGYPISANDALVPTEVFDRDAIERSNAVDLAELLRLANGLELGRNGGPGQTTALFFRGTESDHNLVLVNGVAMNSATVASAAIQNVDTQLLRRVEVVKGPQSTLWGSGALGGIVNVDTLPVVEAGTRAFASAEYGRYASERVSAGMRHGNGTSGLSLAASYFTTDGYTMLDDASDDSGHDNTSFSAGFRHAGDGLTFAASHWQAEGTTEYQRLSFPAPSFSLSLVPVSQDFLNSASTLAVEGEIADHIVSTLQLGLARDHIDQNDDDDFAHTDRTTLAWRNIADLGDDAVLNLGIEAAWEQADIESFGARYDGTTQSQAIYAQYDTTRGRHHWLAGARLLHHEDAGRHGTWNLGYGYRLTPETLLKANVATGFRFPTATERYVFSANPGLRPERSRALELGLSHRIDASQQLDISLFRTDIDDLIVATGVFPNTVNANIAEARIKGVELTYRLRHGPWSLDASLLRQQPRDRGNDDRLLRRARSSAKARLDYSNTRIGIGGELIYSGERDDIDGISFARTTTDDYLLLNLHGDYRLDRDWSAYVKLDNLFDQDYELAAGYNSPRRALTLGIRFQSE